MAGDPAETEQPQGRYPAGAFEAAEQTPPTVPDEPPPNLENNHDPVGKTVSHYRVLERVGGGGMGVVYRAQDLRLGRSVALKFLPEEIGHDPRARERFEREARAASALDHPNICPIYEFGEHDGKPFIVMQLLRGQTLKDILATTLDPATGMVVGKALPAGQVLDLTIQVLAGLEAAHEKGLIHRDIKPANIFVTHRGVAKVLDFGLVKLLYPDGTDSDDDQEEQSTTTPVMLEPAAVELSRVGVALGTAAYMSPEQIRGEALDARTDLFSVGLMMYEMATGRRAFTGENIAGLRNAIMTKTPTPVRQVNHQQPARLERIINKCIEKDPARRYQNAAEVRSDLEKLQSLLEHPLRRRWKLAVASVVAVSGLVAGVVYYLHKQAQFKERETIVLADFNNKTGETVWDESLKQRLANNLGQSPYLNVLSDQKVVDTLKLMKRPATTRVTAEIARDVCLRNNSKALLAGSITRLGGSYELDLEATNCQTGEQLASASGQAKRQEDVIGALLKASDEVRHKLGESLASVQKYDTPLPPATTASLEAIQAYAWGLKVKTTQGAESALPFFKRAVELDPEFGDAYAALGAAYLDTDQSALAMQNLEKAYELRDRVTQRERFHIEADYYDSVKGELEKANQTLLNWIQVYPDDWKPHQNLAANYAELGQYERAINDQLAALHLAPETVDGMTALVGYYNAVNQPAKANATFEDARSHKLEHPYLHLNRYQTGFLEGNDTVMQQELASAAEDPAAQRLVLAAQSNTEAYHGRMDAANDFSQRAVESARHAGQSETAANWRASQALREAELGNKAQAKKLAEEALSVGTGSNVNIVVALTFARIGETAQAQKLAEKLDHDFPQSTMVQNFGLPIVRAAIDLQKDKAAAAIEILQTTLPFEQGYINDGSLGYLYPAYLRGEAYLRTHQPDLAGAEFQKMLNHPGVVQNFITGALAHLQLARAQAAMGNKAAARKSYEDFLALWKEADDGLTTLKAAKTEFQRLP